MLCWSLSLKIKSCQKERKKIHVPVVHQKIRLPDVFRRDPDVLDVLVLGAVPGKVDVAPLLQNCGEYARCRVANLSYQIQPDIRRQNLILLILKQVTGI